MTTSIPLSVLFSLVTLAVAISGLIVAMVKLYSMKVLEAEARGKLIQQVERMAGDIALLTSEYKTLSQFFLRRGQIEAVRKGWGEYRSPFRINGAAFEVVLPFLTVFLPWYAQTLAARPDIAPGELAMRLEDKFGDFIVEKICIPHGVTEGACMVAILEVCRHEYEKKGAL